IMGRPGRVDLIRGPGVQSSASERHVGACTSCDTQPTHEQPGRHPRPSIAVTLVSVVVPVYFSSATLRPLLTRLRAIAADLPDLAFEYVMVDDGSADGLASFSILQEEAAADPRVRALRLSRNFGSNAAILAGLSYCRGDCAVVIAADLQ